MYCYIFVSGKPNTKGININKNGIRNTSGNCEKQNAKLVFPILILQILLIVYVNPISNIHMFGLRKDKFHIPEITYYRSYGMH